MIRTLVSIIIPVYNRERFIGEAVESALDQQDIDKEVIVVDDGSTDGTTAALQRYLSRINYLRQKNGGPPAARNSGIAVAQGEYVTFLDSDDLWPRGRTRMLLDCLNAHPDAGVAMGRMRYARAEVSRFDEFLAASEKTEPIRNYNLGASLIRASVMQTVGTFDETMRYSDDWDWFVRAREKHIRIEFLPGVTLVNRRHAENLSNERDVGNHYTLMMVKKALDRRRADPTKL